MTIMLAKKAWKTIVSLTWKRSALTLTHPTDVPSADGRCPYDAAPPQPMSQMPRPHGMCPVVGSALATMAKYQATGGHRMIMDRIRTLGKVYYDKLFDYECVNVASPEDAATVFRNEGTHPTRPDFNSWIFARHKLGLPLGVVLSNGDLWYNHRRAMDRQLLMYTNLHKYVPALNEIAADYIQILLQNQQRNRDHQGHEYVRDLKHEQFRWSLESTSRLLYDKRIGCLKLDGTQPPEDIVQFAQAVDTMFETSQILVVMNPATARILAPVTFWRHCRAWKTVFEIGRRHVDAKVAEFKQAEHDGRLEEIAAQGGFLLSLLDGKWRTGRQRDVKLEVDQAYCNAIEVMAAGVDTVATSQQWLMHLLAVNPDKQERLRRELEPVKDGMITPEFLTSHKSSYLKACVKESMRLRPVLVGTGRVLDKDVVIGGYIVPRGTKINILDFVMATDEKNFSNAGSYIPERWLDRRQNDDGTEKKENNITRSNSNTQNFTSLPFGFGARNCIGRRFAETEMYILTSRIVRDYKIVDVNGHLIEPATTLLMTPSEPVKIRLEKRIP